MAGRYFILRERDLRPRSPVHDPRSSHETPRPVQVRRRAVVVLSRSHVSTPHPHWRPGKAAIAAGLVALFAFRLGFGLSSEFFFEDETQIFLIGLRHYTTGQWPYFGPDIVWTKSEIPGALQGLLISVPLRIVPAP